jgi:hypothetical protein
VSAPRNLAIDWRRPPTSPRSTAAGTSATSAAAPTRRCRHHRSPDRTSSIDRPKSANNNFTKKKLPQRRPGGPTRSSGSLSAPRARGIGDDMVHSGSVSAPRNLAIDWRRPPTSPRSTTAGTSAASAAAPTRRCRHHRSPDRTSSIDRPKSANNNFTKKKLPQRRPGGPTRSSGSLVGPDYKSRQTPSDQCC